jgi:hypothetical protein
VDLSDLGSNAARRRFMAAFAEALYETNEEPLHLVLDEADLWAPQRPIKGWEGLLGNIEEIVRRGRVRGFIPWLITQRPAVVHKDVLSQADILIAMKLTASQDRDAIGAWIEGQADRQECKRILGDLPRLQRGEGYLWAPSHGLLKHVAFPPIIQHAIWLYLRFNLRDRDVEELLAERGLDVSYETVRRWVLKFGPLIARKLRQARPRPSAPWHLDEMVVRIAGKRMYLWRAGRARMSQGVTLTAVCRILTSSASRARLLGEFSIDPDRLRG